MLGTPAIAPFKLRIFLHSPSLSTPGGVHSMLGNKFKEKKMEEEEEEDENKDATNHTSHCSGAVRTTAVRKG